MSSSDAKVGRTSDPEEVRNIARRLLVDTTLIAVHCTSLFSLEFQRASEGSDPRLPLLVSLTLISDWWLGERREWQEFLSSHPEGLLRDISCEDALRGYALICLTGSKVATVEIGPDASLNFSTSFGKTLRAAGREDTFEESWIIDVPKGVPGHEFWSVVCTDRGELFGRQPKA
jgi:hypothetical protein